MHSLDMDILRDPARARWSMWLLLAIGLVFAFDTARHYTAVRDQVIAKRERLARVPAQATHQQKPADSGDDDEYKFARQTISRLAMPWDQLFRSLEAAKTGDLALIDIDPDPSNSTVMLSGEAASYLAVLTYVARLAEQPELHDVRLARHENKSDQKSCLFSISASWRGEQ
jgi:hypothetical protein